MEVTKKNIEQYIARFLDGETTNAEEQAIYRFFRMEEVPEHLRAYAPMFAWYEGGMQGEPQPVSASVPAKRKPLFARIPMAVWSAGIAAMLVVTLGLGLLLSSDSGEALPEGWECYEGSYIIVNGKRITDLKQIMPFILEEERQTEQTRLLAEKRIREVEEAEERIRELENIN